MTDLMKQLTARKVERRRQLAALPVGEKLRMLEEMVAAAKRISATQPAKPVNPVRGRRQVPQRN
jgi:hypothetical protein